MSFEIDGGGGAKPQGKVRSIFKKGMFDDDEDDDFGIPLGEGVVGKCGEVKQGVEGRWN